LANGGLDLHDNNFLVLSSRQLADDYKANFECLTSKLHTHPRKTKKPDMDHLLSPERAIKIGNVDVTPYFSGGGTEEIENAVVALIKKAKKVRIMAMLISDLGVLEALSKFKPAGKDIEGVLDPHEMKQVMTPPRGKSKIPAALFWFARKDKRFVAAPSHAYSQNDNNDFMHNKVMIIDDRIVVTGSYNFSENAESNDENMLILESSAVAAAYTAYFESLFTQYQKRGTPLPPK
jgi:phosphatidylserine/phosphatidylglycerophosphate/cardiolipin synthase-like enzyme